jgi:hypothetical protein
MMNFARLRLAARPPASGSRAGCVVGLALATALFGCGEAPTPEQEVREVLEALEAAAEGGQAGDFAELVSASYADPYGHDREKLRAFVAFHVMQSGRGREVIVRVRDVQFPERERAAVTLAVGLAGAGSRLSAEVYAVDMDLAREHDAWRISWAQWRAAPATDLL